MLVVEACMSGEPKHNDALVHEGSDSIEDILDAQFRRRFSEMETDRPA